MIFPIGDDQVRGGHASIISYVLLAINVLLFAYEFTLPPQALDSFFLSYGAVPVEITQGIDLHTLITSMFLHGGVAHVLGNMMFLWVFADNIEATVGSWSFLLFYFLGGLFAALTHAYIDHASIAPMIGASGAISAVLGAYLVMFPYSRIKMWAFIFFRFRILAIFFLGIWILQQFLSGFAALSPATADLAGGVAWWAHIGGFVFGIVAGFYYRIRYHMPELDKFV